MRIKAVTASKHSREPGLGQRRRGWACFLLLAVGAATGCSGGFGSESSTGAQDSDLSVAARPKGLVKTEMKGMSANADGTLSATPCLVTLSTVGSRTLDLSFKGAFFQVSAVSEETKTTGEATTKVASAPAAPEVLEKSFFQGLGEAQEAWTDGTEGKLLVLEADMVSGPTAAPSGRRKVSVQWRGVPGPSTMARVDYSEEVGNGVTAKAACVATTTPENPQAAGGSEAAASPPKN